MGFIASIKVKYIIVQRAGTRKKSHILLQSACMVGEVTKYYLKVNCDKLKMYIVNPGVWASKLQPI